MINRKINEDLTEWTKKDNRKPLVLRGARQVGKTTAINIFSRQFKQYIYLNLELREDREIFEQDLSFHKLFEAIFFIKGADNNENSTLIFIDEIQNSPQAIASLRYFYESGRDLFVIGAGSLLEVYLHKENISFPVGRVEFLYMHPLSFEEYLSAHPKQNILEIYKTIPIPEYAHNTILELFHEYTLIGGMPEICSEYLSSFNLKKLAVIYESLLISYIDDAGKYASNRNMYQIIRHIIETVPREAGNRIKYQGFGNTTYRSREVGEAFRILERSMLISLIHPATAFDFPLLPDKKKSPRLQFLDTGLLNYYSGIQKQLLNPKDLNSLFRGRISEHIVGQELFKNEVHSNNKPCFWVREKSGTSSEVDFLLESGKYPIPVEVKSGKTGRLRSLHFYMENSRQKYAIRLYSDRISRQNVKTTEGKEYTLLNLPYYLAGRLNEYADYFFQ